MRTLSAEQLRHEVAGAGLAMSADADTLLRYAIHTDPDPLQAGGEEAQLTLVISNPGHQLVTCAQIEVSLPVGGTAKGLLADAEFDTLRPDGWGAMVSGGVITLTPDDPESGKIGADGLVLVIAGMTVSPQPGTAQVHLTETASSGSRPLEERDTHIEVAKFPARFRVAQLRADPFEDVAFGGSTVASWSGSPGADYTLQYDAGDGPRTLDGLPPVGSHTVRHLVSFPCVFTLVVKVTVPGLDTPLVLQRQVSVTGTRKTAILRFEGSTAQLPSPAFFSLRWQTELAASLRLHIAHVEGSLDVSQGGRECILQLAPGSGTELELTAYDGTHLGSLSLPAAPDAWVRFVLTAIASNGTIVQASVELGVKRAAFNVHHVKWFGGYYMLWQVEFATGEVTLNGKTVPAFGYEKGLKPGDYTFSAPCYWGPATHTEHLT